MSLQNLLRGAALIVSLGFVLGAHAMTPSELFAKVSPSIWGVKTYDRDGLPLRQGSAVVIAPETLVTNCHVLGKASRIALTFENITIGGTLELWDTARDLCQIKAKNLNSPAVKVGSAAGLVVGQTVYTIGNPRGLELTLGSGLVSSLRKDDKGQLERVQTSAPISPGSSGGGLFDEQGRLVGVTTSQIKDGQNLNFAVPAEWVKELPARHLARSKEGAEAQQASADSRKTGTTQARTWRYYFSDLYGKRGDVTIQERDSGNGSTIEEAVIKGVAQAGVQWQPGGPLFRMRGSDGMEWAEVSPELFNGTPRPSGVALWSVSVLGDVYTVDLRPCGEDQIVVEDKPVAVSCLEIRGRKPQPPPNLLMQASFVVKTWFSKELGRNVRTQFSTAQLSGKLLDQSEIRLVGLPVSESR